MKEQVGSRHPERRRSACADAALRAEILRVEKMTIEQRVRAALEMGKGFPEAAGDGKNRRAGRVR